MPMSGSRSVTNMRVRIVRREMRMRSASACVGDYAHLAITLCRCMNIPARYCTGYLGDIGVPLDPNPMDFSVWFDVYLEGGWYAVDARHNHPRIGRILMARGWDATDAAISTALGIAELVEFTVFTNEVAMA
jgi:transglutaminase-like putative cysteine protease